MSHRISKLLLCGLLGLLSLSSIAMAKTKAPAQEVLEDCVRSIVNFPSSQHSQAQSNCIKSFMFSNGVISTYKNAPWVIPQVSSVPAAGQEPRAAGLGRHRGRGK